jgi:excisionase family DNA binding protein
MTPEANGTAPDTARVPEWKTPESAGSTMLLTADDLAARWQVSKAHVYRLAREGRIPTVPIGRYYRFRLSSIEAWEAAQDGCERMASPSGTPTHAGSMANGYPAGYREAA